MKSVLMIKLNQFCIDEDEILIRGNACVHYGRYCSPILIQNTDDFVGDVDTHFKRLSNFTRRMVKYF